MTPEQIHAALVEIVGSDAVAVGSVERLSYSFDATKRQCLPDFVVHATGSEQVCAIVRLANTAGIPIVPRGAGSGFSGGSLPVRGGIALVLTRMNRILEIDTENLLAVVEPGVITAQLQQEVEKLGLFYPPDPASKAFSTLGGNIAECAGGPHCLKYGVTRDYVLGLDVVLPSGELIHTGGRTMKNVVGYDLTRLFVGSEGTLGIVTRIILKLLPKPNAIKTLLATFSSIDGAARAVPAILRSRVIPAALEFMDASAIDCVRRANNLELPLECRALLIIEVDGEPEELDRQTERILNAIRPLDLIHTQVAAGPAESEAIWQMRRAVSPSLRKVNPDKFNEDIVVPRSKIPETIRALEELSARFQVPIVNFGHAGDGNIHVNVLVDLSIEGMQATVDSLLDELFHTVVALGGSISGEHGIGTAKAAYIGMELNPASLACMCSIKKALDPNNIMNPGKIFPEEVFASQPLVASDHTAASSTEPAEPDTPDAHGLFPGAVA